MEDIVSEFIVGTCRVLPKSNINVFESMHLQDFIELDNFLIVCGSCAEFFNQPLQSCISDVDFFKMNSSVLAFTNEKPVLPFDVRHIADTVSCFLMEPYDDYPAFVRLRLLGHMRYNWESNSFEFIQANVERRLNTTENYEVDPDDGKSSTVGPATRSSISDTNSLSFDSVDSIWCPQWPSKAKDWPFQGRKYGWPTPAIIHEVVQNGCHVVYAKHPTCKDDEYQCRLSFSVAEVILLQSWSPVQQIVYHMLRFIAKRKLIHKDCTKEDEVLCTYHFKTLMLWSCEDMSSEWWNSVSVIKICCSLLEKLSQWLKEARCPNYFIPDANLFHEHFNKKVVDETARHLIYYSDSDNLSLWFLKHYMQPNLLDVSDAKFTHDVLNCEFVLKNREAMKAINPKSIDFYVSLRSRYEFMYIHHSVEKGFGSSYLDIIKYIIRFEATFKDELDCRSPAVYESCYWFYGSSLLILHAAHLLDCKELRYDSEWFVEVMRHVSIKPKRFRSKHHNLPRPLNTGFNRSQLYFIKAQDLMENLNGSNNDLEFRVLSEISKGLLWKALECQDSKRNTIDKATLSYMAALHFSASEYQIVLDLCSRVIMIEKPEQEDTETLNAGCLLYIEDIAMIIGFYLIFMKIKDASLHYTKRQFFLDLRLTPEVFTHYLSISSVERADVALEPNNIFQTPSFLLDSILMTITTRKFSQISKRRNNILCLYQRTNPINELKAPNENPLPSEENINRLLQEYSLQNLTSFYSAIYKDFGFQCCTVDCYHAAYLFQCRRYPEVLGLCERILNEPDLQNDLKELAFANVMVVPPFDSYFDRDIQCLLGLHTLLYYLSPLNEDLRKVGYSEMTTFQHHFAQRIYSGKHSLSTVLNDPYSLRSQYFLGRHFLARYLKIRCLIDCNHSFLEVLIAFWNLEACLPFEHIIRCFLEQKLGNFINTPRGEVRFNDDKL